MQNTVASVITVLTSMEFVQNSGRRWRLRYTATIFGWVELEHSKTSRLSVLCAIGSQDRLPTLFLIPTPLTASERL